jgi:ABC-2 type transport system ATP-binding protein
VSTLRFHSIRKSFADRVVLDGLSLTVESGEVYDLLGPNGCGKSTAINILSNLLDPDAGTVEVAGQAVSGNARRFVGVCPQEIALYRDLRPAENLRFFAELYGLARAERVRRVAELMQLFGLERYARTPIGALSGGWQRRVNIAVALVHSPAILVLDEPTSAVDVEARHDLWQMIEKLRGGGTTILLTTHHLDEAERLCSRVGIMKDGRVAKEGSVAELLALVPGQAVALIESADEEAVARRAVELGWALRRYAGRLGRESAARDARARLSRGDSGRRLEPRAAPTERE